MIPVFPNFRLIELSDEQEIIQHTSNFLPYSDFNFTSLWSWDTENEVSISYLNGNLVVKFIDYIVGTPFLSFIGNSHIEETIASLLDFADMKLMEHSLRLIPGESLNGYEKENSKFHIEEDLDSFDYVLTIEKLISYKGNKLRGKKNFTKRFTQFYNPVSLEIDIQSPTIRKEVLKVLDGWASEKRADRKDTNEKEFKAIEKFLNSSLSNIVSVGFYVNNLMVGFVIGEQLKGGYAILHFEKAISNKYVGIYPYMMQEFAKILSKKGSEYINYEQDLGLAGLRKSKQSFQPMMLKKYTIKN